MKATPPVVDNFFLQFDDSFPPPFLPQQLKKNIQNLIQHTLSHFTSFTPTTHSPYFTLIPLIMPGPDPRKTKPSAYTIPKAGSSKSVGTRPPLHASGASAKDDNPRPLTHQEVRRGKTQKQPAVSRNSARLAANRRSPALAQRSRVASLKRPDNMIPNPPLILPSWDPKPPLWLLAKRLHQSPGTLTVLGLL